jgi:hypothetical protein
MPLVEKELLILLGAPEVTHGFLVGFVLLDL